MARKTNYQQEKRQRELEKQKKKELKKERKQNQKDAETAYDLEAQQGESQDA